MKRSPVATIATVIAASFAACMGFLVLVVLGDVRDRIGTEIGRAIGSAIASVLILAITANFWPAHQLGGIVGRALSPPLATVTPRPAVIPTAPPSPSPAPSSMPTLTATSAPPSQLYITCNDGSHIVGTTADGACRDRGGVRSSSTLRPN